MHRFQALKKLLKTDSSIIGQVQDYYFVIKFQSRGSQHNHGLIWIKSAPTFDEHNDLDIIQFIDQHISTN